MLLYGDSWTRELYKQLVQLVLRNVSRRYAPRSDRINPATGRPVPYLSDWGRQSRWLHVSPNQIENKDWPTWQRCVFGGCGVGIDLDTCGRPGGDDLGQLAFVAKSYLNTSRWDTHVLKSANRAHTSIVVLDPPFRWGCVPNRCEGSDASCNSTLGTWHDESNPLWGLAPLRTHQEVLAELLLRTAVGVRKDTWVVVLSDAPSDSLERRLGGNFVFFPVRRVFDPCFPGWHAASRDRAAVGHGRAGPRLREVALLLMQLWKKLGTRQKTTTRSDV